MWFSQYGRAWSGPWFVLQGVPVDGAGLVAALAGTGRVDAASLSAFANALVALEGSGSVYRANLGVFGLVYAAGIMALADLPAAFLVLGDE